MSYIDKLNELRAKLANDGITSFSGKYRFLSNFWPCEIPYDGKVWKSTEHAYQAAKSLDTNIRNKFINITPSESKKLGRSIEVREDWEQVKYGVMYNIVLDKFIRNPKLGDLLINTGDKYLEETNYWNDKIWGVCKGVGTNWLGKILMDVRNEIK